MSFLDVLFGTAPELDQAEEDLGKPVEAEATNLALHVERCAQRWAMSYRASKANHSQLSQIRLILGGVAVFMVAKSFPDIASFVFGMLKGG